MDGIRATLLATAAIAAAATSARAETPDRAPAKRTAATFAYFSALQESGPFTPEEMAQRKAGGGFDNEALAVDAALNDWKVCVLDALPRWRELRPGPGTLVDGAFGRCADVERAYRDHLVSLTQDGRQVVDLQLAKSLTRTLEEIWRPRLIAAALDQELAARMPAPPSPGH